MAAFRLHAVWIEAPRSAPGSDYMVEIAPAPSSANHEANWVSIVVGRNGLGKSRLLGGIAGLFARAADANSVRRMLGSTSRAIYSIDGRQLQLRAEAKNLVGSDHDQINSLALPRKTIAISTTASDKFPLPRRQGMYRELTSSDAYSYMGLRDSSGRASATSAVFRALEALFEAVGDSAERRGRIAEVFQFLRYSPRVEVIYRWRYSFSTRNQDDVRGFLNSQLSHSPARYPFERLIASDPFVIDEIERIVADIGAETGLRPREIRLVADFRHRQSTDFARFRDMQLLRRAGLVRMTEVELEHVDSGARVDLREVSSGELSLVTSFLGLAATIEDNSLIVIDEPEVSLHPEWQTQYVDLLMRTFAKYRGCHFVIATHSPLVVADVSAEFSNVVSLDPARRVAESSDSYAGESVDEILVKAFDVAGKNNLYLRKLLVEALRLAADGAVRSEAFEDILAQLVRIHPRLEETSPIRTLTDQLVDAKARSAQE